MKKIIFIVLFLFVLVNCSNVNKTKIITNSKEIKKDVSLSLQKTKPLEKEIPKSNLKKENIKTVENTRRMTKNLKEMKNTQKKDISKTLQKAKPLTKEISKKILKNENVKTIENNQNIQNIRRMSTEKPLAKEITKKNIKNENIKTVENNQRMSKNSKEIQNTQKKNISKTLEKPLAKEITKNNLKNENIKTVENNQNNQNIRRMSKEKNNSLHQQTMNIYSSFKEAITGIKSLMQNDMKILNVLVEKQKENKKKK